MLFSLGGMFSIYEGWHKLHPTEAHLLSARGAGRARLRHRGRMVSPCGGACAR
jgi:hypothetical protein